MRSFPVEIYATTNFLLPRISCFQNSDYDATFTQSSLIFGRSIVLYNQTFRSLDQGRKWISAPARDYSIPFQLLQLFVSFRLCPCSRFQSLIQTDRDSDSGIKKVTFLIKSLRCHGQLKGYCILNTRLVNKWPSNLGCSPTLTDVSTFKKNHHVLWIQLTLSDRTERQTEINLELCFQFNHRPTFEKGVLW